MKEIFDKYMTELDLLIDKYEKEYAHNLQEVNRFNSDPNLDGTNWSREARQNKDMLEQLKAVKESMNLKYRDQPGTADN